MYFILFVDRVNISTAAPLIASDLQIGNTELGLVFSAFAFPYAVFQLIGGWIGDRFGAWLVLTACLVVVGLSTALTGAAGGLASLVAIRLAVGFGEGAAFPTATRAMASWTPAGSWARRRSDRQCLDTPAGYRATRFRIVARRLRCIGPGEPGVARSLDVVFSG
jgi:MFS family permease